MRRGAWCVIFFCFLANVSFAQEDRYADVKLPKSASKLYKRGMSAMEKKDYFLSKLYFDQLESDGYQTLQQKFDHTILMYKLGEYDKFSENIEYLEKKNFSNKLLGYYKIQSLIKKSEFDRARDYSLFFLKQRGLRKDYRSYYDHVVRIKQQLDSLSYKPEKLEYYVHTITGDVNGNAADFNPVINRKGIFYGHQDLSGVNYYSHSKLKKSKQSSTRKIMIAEGKENVFHTTSEFPLQFENMELSSFCFDLKGRVMYLTGCKFIEDSGKYFCQIYKSKKENDEWTTPEIIEELRADGFNTTHVNLGYDNLRKSPVLFFASDRKGTKGGMDIWMSYQNPRSLKFYKPRNLGRLINTSKNDITPFFHHPTGRLYFSSDGRGGKGGHDVYYSKYIKGIFSPVETIGDDINSPQDDVFFYPNKTLTRGYFVSNRYSENSLLNPHCCDDIFYFDKNKKPIPPTDTNADIDTVFDTIARPLLGINVIDKNTKEPIKTFTCKLEKIDSSLNIFLIDETIAEDTFWEEAIQKNYDYQAEVYATGYYRKKGYITIEKDSTYILTIELEKVNYNPIVLPLVEFEFDSFSLTHKSKNIIDTMLIPVLISNPTLMIELSAHTDSRGTDEYNEDLSSKRAYAIYFYLINHHRIDRRRLRHKGYGEYAPIAPNEHPDGTDNPEGRQRNRRCEFRILKDEFDPY